MPQDLPQQKRVLRRELRQRRAALDTQTCAVLSAAIELRVLRLIEQSGCLRQGARIALYLANVKEVNLDGLIEPLQARGVAVFAPQIAADAVAFYSLAPSGANITQGKLNPWSLRVPAEYSGGVACCAEEMDAILVPGLAFDECGNRMGQGGGWYDRVLANAGHALKIGVAFDFQIVKKLPHEPHDQAMDRVVTETRVLLGECL